jgi:predicted house-cleaning NTP pyrophosphatase (Maf/HAM1 superfamily)
MKRTLTTIVILMTLTGCAHNFMRGTVAMKTGDKTAHVCLGNNDVKVGEKLNFYKNLCTDYAESGDRATGARSCEMKVLGTGIVTKILNSHYSEVMTEGGFKFSEGTLVQKQK